MVGFKKSVKKTPKSGNSLALVKLNVYDLSEQNYLLYWLGFGVFHTGVEVYGIEYAFGGHDYDASGIFTTKPRKPPGPVEFRQTVTLGETNLTPQEVHDLVVGMGERFRGNRYHLLQMNCNHFASELCKELAGKRAPAWINRLASLAVAFHCLIPATWVPPLSAPSKVPEDDSEDREIGNGLQHKKDSLRLLSNTEVLSDEYPAGDGSCDSSLDSPGIEARTSATQ